MPGNDLLFNVPGEKRDDAVVYPRIGTLHGKKKGDERDKAGYHPGIFPSRRSAKPPVQAARPFTSIAKTSMNCWDSWKKKFWLTLTSWSKSILPPLSCCLPKN
jgi:hypothetical protein